MRIIYSLHAQKKLQLAEVEKLRISKRKIEVVVKKPTVLDKTEPPVLIVIGKLSGKLSLCVAYKKTKRGIKIVTFWPAAKGRYERKILPRG